MAFSAYVFDMSNSIYYYYLSRFISFSVLFSLSTLLCHLTLKTAKSIYTLISSVSHSPRLSLSLALAFSPNFIWYRMWICVVLFNMWLNVYNGITLWMRCHTYPKYDYIKPIDIFLFISRKEHRHSYYDWFKNCARNQWSTNIWKKNACECKNETRNKTRVWCY